MKNKLSIIIFALFLMLSFGSVEQVLACSCAQNDSTCESFGEADAVFVGKVVGGKQQNVTNYNDVKETWEVGEIYFEVEESFSKVKKGSRITISSGTGGSDCGYWFKRGETYLLYAYGDSIKTLSTNTCTRTRLLSKADEDLEFLRKLPPKNSGARIHGSVRKSIKNPYEEGWRQSKPLAEIKLELQQVDGKQKKYEVVTKEDGTYEILEVPAGKYSIIPKLSKNTTISKYETEEFEVADRGCVRRNFSVENDSLLSGKVVDNLGKPVKGIWVDLIPVVQTEKRNYGNDQDLTGKDGEFKFEQIPNGQYILAVNYAYPPDEDRPFPLLFYPNTTDRDTARIIEIGDGHKTTDLRFQMLPRLTESFVKGVVLWEDGTPAKNAEIFLVDFDRLGACTDIKGCFKKTNDKGEFILYGFVGRKYRIRASGEKKINGKETEYFAKMPVFVMEDKLPTYTLILNLSVDPAK